jgi:hypothetical protein
VTAFCYGFDFGPTQTCRSIRGLDRRQVSFINQRHVTEAMLNDAIATAVNGFSELPLPRIWGLGKTASADGTKWDVFPQNLMAEYHIRYGGYGGIGYYLGADSYIALFSRFTTCGSWEGHYILDFLQDTLQSWNDGARNRRSSNSLPAHDSRPPNQRIAVLSLSIWAYFATLRPKGQLDREIQ